MKDENLHYIITLELGIAILNSDKNVIYFNKFKDPINSHVKLKDKDYMEIIEIIESVEILENHKNIKILTNFPELGNLLKNKDFKMIEKISPLIEKHVQINKLNIYLQSSNFSNDKEIIKELRDFSLKWSSLKIQEASEQIDLHISQSINALDEIDKITNTLATRMREWYGLHFPELDNLLQNANTYSLIVSCCGKRDSINKDFLNTIDIPENKIEIIIGVSQRSRGGKITDQNLLIVQNIAEQVISLNKIRNNLEGHIETSMEEIAPNVKGLLTASVGARLISKAGSLRKLSSLSASTIQILGAEKALFRTLKTGSNPPKHGILFQHPVIHSAPKWQRGKMARAIAAKTAIAARLDVYGQYPEVNQALSTKLNDRITEIQEKYKEPPTIEQRNLSNARNDKRSGFGRNARGTGEGSWKGKGGKNADSKFKKNKFKKRYHKSNKK
ncbi:MAG: ribonucleotide-diphosphate reductase subunit beta [Thermoproteota archaeon]|nr:ribonucleotide-diphosphate reductase subunit beta [Thermoproteota archaeon]